MQKWEARYWCSACHECQGHDGRNGERQSGSLGFIPPPAVSIRALLALSATIPDCESTLAAVSAIDRPFASSFAMLLIAPYPRIHSRGSPRTSNLIIDERVRLFAGCWHIRHAQMAVRVEIGIHTAGTSSLTGTMTAVMFSPRLTRTSRPRCYLW